MKHFSPVNRHHESLVNALKDLWTIADLDACARMDSVEKMAFAFVETVNIPIIVKLIVWFVAKLNVGSNFALKIMNLVTI